MKASEEIVQKAFRTTRILAYCGSIGAVLAPLAWSASGVRSAPQWNFVMMGLISLGVLTITVFKRSLSYIASQICCSLIVVSALLAGAAQNISLAVNGVMHEPFIAFKLTSLVVALLAPTPKRLGIGLIFLCATLPLLIYFFVIPPPQRILMLPPEPWTAILYAVVSGVIYFHRVREADYEKQVIETTLAKEAAEERAAAFLALRDLANTPVQILMLASAMLRERCPDALRQVNQIDDGIAKLRELSDQLGAYDKDLRSNGSSLSFDPMDVLERRASKPGSEIR